jgi:single-strand DNA-binding protein
MLALTIAGNLGQDPETKALPSGQTVTSFSVAVAGYDSRKKEKTVTWVKVTLWGNRGEQMAKLLRKGDKCMATGVGSLSTWVNQSGVERTTLELDAKDVAPMGKASGATSDRASTTTSLDSRAAPAAEDFDSDDIPFDSAVRG